MPLLQTSFALALLLHAPPPTTIDAAALREHLDQTIPPQLERTGVPGVVVSVVQGDRVLLSRGWGLADLRSQRPMDGASTVVRVASISKAFTATAIARLEAQGRLDVDAPIDELLSGLALPQRFEPPVTLRHLLSHTAGIINDNVGRVSATPPADGLAPFLTATMPPQMHAPGRMVVYSNHGNALAGLVVEQVTGEPFAEHLQHGLLGPLGMGSSSFELGPVQLAGLATGYTLHDGRPQPYEYLYFRTGPASTLHTTAADMARFMVMHLRGGRIDGEPVLPQSAHRRMLEPVPAIHPALPTYHYAFAHGYTAGHRSRSHGGSVPGFLSRVVLLDGSQVGIFVAQNSLGPSVHARIVEDIVRTFVPEPTPPAVVVAGDGRPLRPQTLVGSYRRASKLDTPAFTRGVFLLLEGPCRVGVDREGFLLVDGDRFVRTGDRVFQRAREGREPETVVFVADDRGEVRWVHRGLSSAERMPWFESRWVQGLVLGVALLVLGGGAAGRRRARSRLPVAAARLALVGAVVPYLAVWWIDAGQEAYLRPLRFGMPPWLSALRVALPLAAALAWLSVWRARADPSRARRALWVAAAATVLPLWELAWRTPASGLLVP